MHTDRILEEDPSFHGWWWLARAYHSVINVLTRFFEGWGITGAQFGVLRCLSDAGEDGLMLSDLSKKLMVTCGNTTGVVDRLEQGGYIRRERQSDDRRVVIARLTPTGAELFQKMMPALRRQIDELMQELSPEEKEAIAATCRKLHLSVEEGT